jgi:riboflavin kinase/FMN adenylyltransferase
MKLIRGIHNLSQAPHGCVLTIGNFDGVHRGHQALLQRLREEGRQRGLPVVVMIFEPQPLELFAADKAPARLTRLREKLSYLAESGVDYVLCVRFDRRFAALTAQDFISELLVRRLGVQFLAVGDDFRFGAGRQGISCYYRKPGRNTALTSPAPKPSAKAACASAARRCVRRWRMTICRRKRCWAIRLPSPDAWCMAMSWGAR